MRHFADGRPAGRYYADGRKYEPPSAVFEDLIQREADPLILAGAADLQRQCDELRGLVREAVAIVEIELKQAGYYDEDLEQLMREWLSRAREVAK